MTLPPFLNNVPGAPTSILINGERMTLLDGGEILWTRDDGMVYQRVVRDPPSRCAGCRRWTIAWVYSQRTGEPYPVPVGAFCGMSCLVSRVHRVAETERKLMTFRPKPPPKGARR